MGMDILTYIKEQPQVLERILKEVPRDLAAIPKISNAQTVYLVGSGTSMNALVAVEPLLARSGNQRIRIRGPLAFMAEPDDEVGPGSLAVILSQTGTSTTTIQAAEHARRHGMRTITLTADRESPIARVSSEILVIPVGPETVGPKTKGYTASVLTLLLFILGQTGRKLEAPGFAQDFHRLIEHCQAVCQDTASLFREMDFVLVAGQGRHLATALEGSLKITEMSGVPAAAFETEEAFHGRFHGLGRKSLAFFVTADPREQAMAVMGAEVLSRLDINVRILNLGGSPPSAHDLEMPWPQTGPLSELDLLSAIVPFQLFGWHIAREKGVVPEKMRYPGLSQKLQIKTKVHP
jgi:fructoselysine-6-P-deglycase FrlB-like protein